MKEEALNISNIINNTELSNYLDDTTILELSKIMRVVDYSKSDKIYFKNSKITKLIIII